MAKKYQPAVFQPTVRPSWAGIIAYISEEEAKNILEAIIKFPEQTEIKSAFFEETIKPDLIIQYEKFLNTCEARGRGAKTYWGEHKLSISNNYDEHKDNLLKDKDKSKDKDKDIDNICLQFEEFWKLYTPIKGRDGNYVAKGNKQKCYKKFANLMKEGVKYETIVGNLEKYLQYCRKNGYCSCGTEVYLNQRRFENDYGQSECVDSQVRDNKRRPVSIVEIADELAKESNYDDSDSIPF